MILAQGIRPRGLDCGTAVCRNGPEPTKVRSFAARDWAICMQASRPGQISSAKHAHLVSEQRQIAQRRIVLMAAPV
jgi:hypothetical protein